MTAGSQREEQHAVPGADNKPNKPNVATIELAVTKKATMTIDQKNKLEEEKDKQAEEIKSLKAQLSIVQKENKKLKGGIFDMTF